MRFSPAAVQILGLAIGLAVVAGCSAANQGPLAPSSALVPAASALQPDKCKTTGGVKLIPCTVTFTKAKTQEVTLSGTDVASSKVKAGPCKGIASFSYFDYGIWMVNPGATTGTCAVVFTGYNSKKQAVGTATLTVTNNS
jgi:hypothetical protein